MSSRPDCHRAQVSFVGIEDLSLAALEQAARVAGASAGALVLLDQRGFRGEVLTSSVIGHPAMGVARLTDCWKAMPTGQRCQAWAGPLGREWLFGSDPAGASASRRSTYLPLRENGTVVGFLLLESDHRASLPPQALDRLGGLLEDLPAALYRAVLRERLRQKGASAHIIGASRAFLELERQIRAAAALGSAPVLVSGERGCGKELACWAVHCWSQRWLHPFLPVLTSALTRQLAAAELFGHESHSFTDARQRRDGRFKAADGGTVFLDEIGDLDRSIQPALLRVLENRELSRVGSDRPLPVDVRVVAATNRNLPKMVKEGRFRADLYDRLAVLEVKVPPLRDRLEDVPLLAKHFLMRHCDDSGAAFQRLEEGACSACRSKRIATCATDSFFARLQEYSWPGNVRELRNLICRLVAAHPWERLEADHLNHLLPDPQIAGRTTPDLTLKGVMRAHIARVLRDTGGNQSQAAARLGLPLSTLRSKMKKLGIDAR